MRGSIFLSFLTFIILDLSHALKHTTRETCQRLDRITFDDSDSASRAFYSNFIPISPDNSYALTSNGLELYLYKPEGRVTTSDGVNDQLANGATINSTFIFDYGKVTFEVESPTIHGVIVAGIMIGDESEDEIDIEHVCAEPKSWQTNVFVPGPRDPQPLYNTFSSKETVDSITFLHSYSIEVTPENILWSLDGRVVRALPKDQCTRNGFSHYPTHTMRLQLGIWDASKPAGTAKWAGGPIDWDNAPDKITATFKSVAVECP
ncbi:Glycoside hydrolase family 16 protein [Mycena sanguinolenta]|uniref:Glycoside hydrolase family 16 protein n=1 Tax=Mycena sanguinolenta TaxID=230812 RepID=A0A8H6Z1R5_9AGAR|nr:Glycoside hydrolase family 16 protein [Mycena sanguinolenta]